MTEFCPIQHNNLSIDAANGGFTIWRFGKSTIK
jgi:hypothetical protein